MNNTERDGQAEIDPDPFVVMATCLAAVGVALQFIQTFKLVGSTRTIHIGIDGNERTPLLALQRSLKEFDDHLISLERTIRDGVNSPDKEYYEKEFGVNLGCFSFKRTIHQEYTRNLSQLFSKLNEISTWANHLIGQHPEIAILIGKEMLESLSGADVRINELMREGATNDQVLAEVRLVLRSCEAALDKVLPRRN